MHVPETIGVISDTHGLLRPEALAALHGCDRIIHAGDVGAPDVLDGLRLLAPTVAVRGNVDTDAFGMKLPRSRVVELEGHRIYVLHILDELRLDELAVRPAPEGVSAVIYGHSHQPSIEDRDGVLYLNPGSAGPRRFRLPVTVARLSVVAGRLQAQIVDL
jgi:hypothetical protein